MDKLQLYIALFFIYSIIGWVVEVFFTFIATKKIINRGFLIGPYVPIYGIGSLMVTIILTKSISYSILVFIESIIICGALEYLISFAMEKLFGARWWDYSHKNFNINGRICISNLLAFGIGCVLCLYLFNPILFNILNNISLKTIKIVNLILIIIFTIDLITTLLMLFKIKNRIKFISRDSTEEINKYIRQELLKNSNVLLKRFVISFPNLKVLYKKIKKKLE